MRKDYFKILGLLPNADESSIKRAYRALAKKYHPDINKAKEANEMFFEINEAYEFLIDAKNRSTINEPTVGDWRQKEYENVEFRRMRDEMKDKARQYQRKKADEKQRQFEMWQKSGIYDLSLVGVYLIKILIVIIPFVFLFNIFRFIFFFDFDFLIVNLILFLITGFAVFFIFMNLNFFFKKKTFYYSISKLLQLFNERKESTLHCFYCKALRADSKSYRLELIKLKDIKLDFKGFRQQTVNYKNETLEFEIPRSLKAFRIHVLCTVSKILWLVLSISILNFDSFLWKILFGLIAGEIFAVLLLIVTRTKSNVSYLYSWAMLIKLMVWMGVIVSLSYFELRPFNIYTSDYIYLAMFSLLIFDSFLEQFMYSVLGKRFVKPFTQQPENVMQAYDNGYKLYNDIPVFSVLYPLGKWFLG